MKNPLLRLREMQGYIGSAEKMAAEHILSDPNIVIENGIRELAKEVYVSPATIVRLTKHLGFDGYKEFRQAVLYELAQYNGKQRDNGDSIRKDDSIKTIIDKTTSRNIMTLQETQQLLDVDRVEECTKLIADARCLRMFGMGASLCVAEDAYLKFLRVNKLCLIAQDWHSQYLIAKNSQPEDVAIFISYSGETSEMIKCMEAIGINHTPSILITRFAPSTMSKMADHVLYTPASESLFRSGATSSRMAQLNIVDILFTAYATANYDYCISQINSTHIEKNSEN
ncbi:MurR/RpiR family transcriptional regulator [Butyrivibrio sp. Su6]|jgi:DNA-binding MurR/RpiR family transcriptional regulator|uniref:MurR/RpiR family transcriptional regulator n=1 Tax=Butyrivibrio sp. Su6 TaxID=1520810 RepID=UPI000CDE9E51|nr:MurR/RpiR family transcriptional regulator [Butyrivibrio sp. Su6]